MTIEQILALIPEEKKEAAKKALEEYGAVDADKVKAYIKSDDGAKIVQPLVDSAVTKALKTYEKNFMDNEFPKRLDERVKELHPDETPEQKRIAALEAENRKIKQDSARQSQISRAVKMLEKMTLPIDLADRFAGLTDDETDANINSLNTVVEWRDKAVKAKDDEWLAKGGKPGGGDGNGNSKTMKRAEFEALDIEQKMSIPKQGISIID